MSDNTPVSASSSATSEAQRQNLSILVVEKDSQTLAELRDMLRAAHYQVFSETSAERVRQRDDLASFAAVLLNHRSARDLLSHIRQIAPQVPIILMSRQADVRQAVQALWQGASDFLAQPISPSLLQMSLEQVLSYPRSEAAFQRERTFSDDLLELAPAVFLVLDAQGRIVRFNPFMEELSGYRLTEVQGQDWAETFLSEADRPPVREIIQQILSGETVSGSLHPIATRNGQPREIFWRFRAFTHADDGNIQGILAVGQDVADLFLNAQKKKRRMERLAVIGQTIASVSHETRNVLYSLKLGLDLLPSLLEERDESLEIIRHLQDEQARLARLFEDIRKFAAPMRLERRQQNLSEIWQKAWTSLEGARKGREAVLHEKLFAPTTCLVDGFRLEEVFRNLFENSLAACADPVEIQITCMPASLNHRKAISIQVRDNGPGLTPDQRDKLFDAFFTTKSGGTGLGMALAKRIIEAHGGIIAVNGGKSEGGAEFIIRLPFAGKEFPQSSDDRVREE